MGHILPSFHHARWSPPVFNIVLYPCLFYSVLLQTSNTVPISPSSCQAVQSNCLFCITGHICCKISENQTTAVLIHILFINHDEVGPADTQQLFCSQSTQHYTEFHLVDCLNKLDYKIYIFLITVWL